LARIVVTTGAPSFSARRRKSRSDAADQDGPLRGAQALRRFRHRLGQLARVRAGPREAAIPLHDVPRHRDRDVHHIPVDLQVSRAMLREDRAKRLVHFLGGKARVRQDASRAGDLREDAALGLHVLHLVVHAGELALRLAGATRDDQQRDLLGVGSGHRVHQIVPPGTVGDADHAQPAGAAGIAVGREAHRRLVGEGHDLEPTAGAEAVEEAEHQVAGEPEDVLDPGATQVGHQEVAELHPGAHQGPPSRWSSK
jgi:hypothetical protein